MAKAVITCRSLMEGCQPQCVIILGLEIYYQCVICLRLYHDFPLSPLRPPLLPFAFIGPTRCSAPGFITLVNENQLSERKFPGSARRQNCAGFHSGFVEVVRVLGLFFFCSGVSKGRKKNLTRGQKLNFSTFFSMRKPPWRTQLQFRCLNSGLTFHSSPFF